MSDNTPRKIKMICMGQRWSGDSLFQQWKDLATGEVASWGKSLVDYASPGSVYTFSVAKEEGGKMTSVYSSGQHRPVFEESVRNDEITLWALEDRAARAAHAKHQQARKAKENDPVKEICLPLRKVLNKTMDPYKREALINALVVELRRPLTKEERE